MSLKLEGNFVLEHSDCYSNYDAADILILIALLQTENLSPRTIGVPQMAVLVY